MTIGVTVITCSILYSILLSIVYFSKPRIENNENKIYSILIRITLIGLFLELFCCFLIPLKDTNMIFNIINMIFNRAFIIYLVTWEYIFTIYMFLISFNKNDDFYKKLRSNGSKKFIKILYILIVLSALILPLNFYYDGVYVYSYGTATNLTYFIGGIGLLCDIFCLLKNSKNLLNKKFVPLYILITLMIILFIIRRINPGLIIINSAFSFITAIMYFTIENPDMQMIGELYKNKELVEQSYEDKSNFLFELTQQVRTPIMNISKECKELENINNVKELKQGIKELKNYIRQLDFVVNDVLDVSTLEAQKVKFVENRYNVNTLYNELISKIQPMLPKNIEFITTSTKNVPYLYGDSIKLKQVLYSILLNAVKKTEQGFIEFHIDTIERYDVCRLLFSIKDSGCGISIDKINEILAVTGEINQDDIKEMEKSEINMQLCQKIIKLFGGNLMIKSNPGKGTEVLLSIDQKVVLENKNNILDKYEYTTNTKKQVLIISQTKELIRNIKQKLQDVEINCSVNLYGRDAIDKIKSGKIYDYILIEDDMNQMNGYTTLKELNKIKGFNIPVIVMLKENKEQIKEHYLEDGFKDYLLIKNFKSEIDRIIDKY